MRRFLSALVLFTFAIVMQMSFVHAVDMEMGRSMVVMNMSHHAEHDGALCSDGTHANTQSCFTEIGESKWIESVRKIELTPFFFAALFVFLALPILYSTSRASSRDFRRRILYNSTPYLGLYGIIRNVN